MFQIVNGHHGSSDWDGVSNFLSVSDQAALVSIPDRVEDRSALQKIEEHKTNSMDSDRSRFPVGVIPAGVIGMGFSLLPMVSEFSNRVVKYGPIIAIMLGLGACSLPLVFKWSTDQELSSSDWLRFGITLVIAGVGAVLGFTMNRYIEKRAAQVGWIYADGAISELIALCRKFELIGGSFVIPLGTSVALHTGFDYFFDL